MWPEQEWYEAIRPLVLFHETAGERAKEIDVPRRTLVRKADEFEKYGMQSLFPSGEQGGARETSKTLPPEIRQLIVDLHTELPTMSWREIAEVCYIRYEGKALLLETRQCTPQAKQPFQSSLSPCLNQQTCVSSDNPVK